MGVVVKRISGSQQKDVAVFPDFFSCRSAEFDPWPKCDIATWVALALSLSGHGKDIRSKTEKEERKKELGQNKLGHE